MPSAFEITYNCGFHCVRDCASGEIIFRDVDRNMCYVAMTGALQARVMMLECSLNFWKDKAQNQAKVA